MLEAVFVSVVPFLEVVKPPQVLVLLTDVTVALCMPESWQSPFTKQLLFALQLHVGVGCVSLLWLRILDI